MWTSRSIISELGYSATDWTLVLPLINFIINHLHREVLNGRTPIEVMTGRKPKTPVDLVLWDSVLLKDAKGQVVEWKQVAQYCNGLAKALDDMHQELRDAEKERRRKKEAKAKNASRGLQIEVGDLVMVAAWGNAAHVKRGSKLCPAWQGPYEVLKPLSTTAYEVRLVGRTDKKPKAVHWSRMKLFGDKTFNVTEKLTRTAVNDCQKFDVSSFQKWRMNDDGEVELKVRWEGFQPQDDTWEDLEQLYGDVPVLVKNYLADHVEVDDRLATAAAALE